MKEPEAWTAEEGTDTHGGISSDPRALLCKQVKFWVNIWTDDNKLMKYKWPEQLSTGRPLPPIMEEQVEKASNMFPEKTSGSPDGWHPRHFSVMSRQGRK